MQLTVKDVAGLLNVSEKTVYRWIEEQKLPGYRMSGQYRFNRAELLEWATANRINVSPRIFEEPESGSAPLPELSDALATGGVFYRLTGKDKPAVLRSVVEVLRLPDKVDREFLLQVLLAREALESTAIGDGIAIPHVRNPIVLHVPQPIVTLCFLEAPVDFGALDGQPVKPCSLSSARPSRRICICFPGWLMPCAKPLSKRSSSNRRAATKFWLRQDGLAAACGAVPAATVREGGGAVTLLLFAMAILLLGAVAVLLSSRSEPKSFLVRRRFRGDCGQCWVASRRFRYCCGGAAVELRLPWPVPFGEFFIELDPLSAWFLLPTLLLSALSAIYGVGYLRVWQGKRSLGPVVVFLLSAGAGHDARAGGAQCRAVSDCVGIDGAGVVLSGDVRA